MQNFGVANKEHYGMLWYFWSGQFQVYLSLEIHNNNPWSLHAVGGYFNIVVCSIL